MNVYIYQAALLCEECGIRARKNLDPSEDSDTYPQGPIPDGGGEADVPQTCDHCFCFLRNSLTRIGLADTAEMILRDTLSGNYSNVREWAEFYDLDTLTELVDAMGKE